MSAARTAVERVFGGIINYFKFLDFKKNFKIGLSAMGKMYIDCALVQNARTILYQSISSEYFGINPPLLHGLNCKYGLYNEYGARGIQLPKKDDNRLVLESGYPFPKKVLIISSTTTKSTIINITTTIKFPK